MDITDSRAKTVAESPSVVGHASGLCDLVGRWSSGSFGGAEQSWREWFEAAMEQLETDDLIDSRLTDMMAECLAEADEALESGYDHGPALNRLSTLYHHNLESVPLEVVWRRKAASLGAVQLNSSTWAGLWAALDAAARGETAKVENWLERMEEYFLTCWEAYDASDVLESEITTESVLCHRLLLEGTEFWLEALTEFRNGLSSEVPRQTVVELAEQGQRYLVVVQLMHDEVERRLNSVLAWARD